MARAEDDHALARSRAFRAASLASEERRAYAVIAIVFLLAFPWLLIRPGAADIAVVRNVGLIAGVALLAIEAGSVALVRRARRRGRDLPGGVQWIGVAAECSLPTAVIGSHIAMGTLPAYTALTTPPLLVYGLLIGLTTLRLRPGLCLEAGLVSACGYAALVALVALVLRPAFPEGGWPRAAYVMAPSLLLCTGVTAAWVAREIRAHVEAALQEAEFRRRMDRLEHDLGVARTIQQSLLPRGAPAIPGFDVAGWNRSADQTGGDYYDWQRLPDGSWIISLADVSGHGIGPALVTAACRAYVRASSAHHPELGSLLGHVNRLLSDDLPEGRFVTMAQVILDPRTGSAALLSAGHGPIVFRAASGEVRDIQPQDVPLAVIPDATFGPAKAIPLKPGDVLALVTDGFIDWARGGERREAYGITRLRESFGRHARGTAAEIIQGITRDVGEFAGAEPPQDDLTIVVIRRSGLPVARA